jgi:hypothetical protein
MVHCYPKGMMVFKHLRLVMFILFMLLLSACGSIVPPAVATPPAPCADGQTNTPENPCTPDTTNNPTDPGGNPTDPGGNPTDPGGNPTPTTCADITVEPRTNPKLFSAQTTLKSCYAPGSSETVVMSIKLVDNTVVFVKPTIVFDIVRVSNDAQKTVTSVAGDLLDGRPSANPNIFESDISKDQLLAGLRAAVVFKFKSSAAKGNYVMVLSLFKDADAFNPKNLVGRIYYDFEIK